MSLLDIIEMRTILKTGVGKSCILDSFYFALFGTTMREISKIGYVVNRKVGKNCIVRLEADIIDSFSGKNTYFIERKLAPQSIKIWKNSIEITKSTTAETNKYIEELFHADKEIFQNCILMRANNSVPFMAKKKSEKKNFIEAIFNLNIFSSMSKMVREDIRAAKNAFSLEKNAQNLHEVNIASYQKELSRLEELQNLYEVKRQHEINAIKNKIAIERTQIDSYNIQITKLNEIWDKNRDISNITTELISNENFKQKLSKVKSQLLVEDGILRRDLDRLESDTGVCPTCKRAYSEEYIKNITDEKCVLKDKIAEIIQKISTIEEKILEVDNSIKSIKETLAKDAEYKQLFNELQLKINESARIINVYNEHLKAKPDIEDFSGIENFKTLIESTHITLSKIQITIEELEKELAKLNVCEHILGEYGIRSYIVNKLLDLFNNRIMYYLKSFKSTFSFRFDEYFEEELKDSNGIICLYGNCSGAEMKKIDLAISFAINDLLNLQKQLSYNIIFFDEILDSSLDDKSLNIILNFISEHTQKENKAVYIISHKAGAQIPFVNETIMLEKINGFTKRIFN